MKRGNVQTRLDIFPPMKILQRIQHPQIEIRFDFDELEHIEKALWHFHNDYLLPHQKDMEWPNEKVAFSHRIATDVSNIVRCKND